MGLWSRKSIDDTTGGDEFRRHLGVGNLTLLGIGGTIGAGIFVLTGTAAAMYAGPAVVLSFVISGLGCLFAALCYAELASMIPVSGNAYTYTYVTMGEFIAWIIGWNLVLEFLFAAATVGVGWSGYFTAFMGELGFAIPSQLSEPTLRFDAVNGVVRSGAIVNLPAMAIILGLTTILHFGIRGSAFANNLMVIVKVTVVLLVIGFGAAFVHVSNWQPFIPPNSGEFGVFGWSGIVRAAGVVFFAYLGFDLVAASSNEAKNPTRDIPRAILGSMAVCTILYIAMCLVMTGLVKYTELNVPHPAFVAIARVPELLWLKPLVNIGAIVGLASAILILLYGQTRAFYAMAMDRLLPDIFARVSPVRRVPVFGTWFVGIIAALVAGVLPIQLLGELVSIGALLAFTIVCVGVLILRRREPNRARGFRTPFIGFVGPAGIAICLYMMVSLPEDTWIRFVVWSALGLAIYFLYSRHRSRLADRP